MSPFVSESQRRYMFAKHPEIAKRWVAEGKGYVQKGGNMDKEDMKDAMSGDKEEKGENHKKKRKVVSKSYSPDAIKMAQGMMK